MKHNFIRQLLKAFNIFRDIKMFPVFLMLMVMYIHGHAQNSCTQNIKVAEKKFEHGHLREVPELLSECMAKNQFTSEEMLKAYKLLTLTYLYLDDSLNAEISFYKLLKSFPDYQINESVEPAELVNLYRTYRTLPLYSFGFQAGSNLTNVVPTRLFGIDNLAQREEGYMPLLGYSAGLRFEVPLSKRIFVSTGAIYNLIRYRNIRSLSTTTLLFDEGQKYFAEVHFSENQSWINIPLLLGASIGNSHVRHYLYGGASSGYLLSSKANVSRKSNFVSNTANEIKGPDINVRELRNHFNYWGIIGAGLRIKSGLNHINIEGQCNFGISNMVNPTKRYANSQLLNRYGYLDNDVRISFFTLKGSYMITRYKPKKVDK